VASVRWLLEVVLTGDLFIILLSLKTYLSPGIFRVKQFL
jgi:hypothetical protein